MPRSEDDMSRLSPVLDLIARGAPECAAEVEQTRRAAAKGSPVLYRRLSHLVDKALRSGEFDRHEKTVIGEALLALSQGRMPQKRIFQMVSITLPPSYIRRVSAYCHETGISRSELMRRGIDAVLGPPSSSESLDDDEALTGTAFSE